MKRLAKKAALVLATTAIGVTMFASVAFAAPTLDAGQTSGGPHDSRGNCASCHDYKAPKSAPAQAAPAPAPAAPLPAAPPSITTTTVNGQQFVVIVVNPYAAPPVAAAPPVTSVPTYDNNEDDD